MSILRLINGTYRNISDPSDTREYEVKELDEFLVELNDEGTEAFIPMFANSCKHCVSMRPLMCIYAWLKDGTLQGTVKEWQDAQVQTFNSLSDLKSILSFYTQRLGSSMSVEEYCDASKTWLDDAMPEPQEGELYLWVEIVADKHGVYEGVLRYNKEQCYFEGEEQLLGLMMLAFVQ